MEKEMETTIQGFGLQEVQVYKLRFYRDTGKENRNYHLGFRVSGNTGV